MDGRPIKLDRSPIKFDNKMNADFDAKLQVNYRLRNRLDENALVVQLDRTPPS